MKYAKYKNNIYLTLAYIIICLSLYIYFIFSEKYALVFLNATWGMLINTITIICFLLTILMLFRFLDLYNFYLTLNLFLLSIIALELFFLHLLVSGLIFEQDIVLYIDKEFCIVKYYTPEDLHNFVKVKYPTATLLEIDTILENTELPIPKYIEHEIKKNLVTNGCK